MEQKLSSPLTFKTLTVDSAKRGRGTIQLSLTKLQTWFVIVCETDILEDTTCTVAYSLTASTFKS